MDLQITEGFSHSAQNLGFNIIEKTPNANFIKL